MVGIIVSVVVHGLVGLYLYKNKFKLQEYNYQDDAVDVELIEPA
ncbi:MAG: energy transducer TonB, partial [Brevundimonas sp.]